MIEDAGRLVGVGDWRPKYGRFNATVTFNEMGSYGVSCGQASQGGRLKWPVGMRRQQGWSELLPADGRQSWLG